MTHYVEYAHLDALISRLQRERNRLANAKTGHEMAMRKVFVEQIEHEIAKEREFLKMPDLEGWTDDDLLSALGV